MSIGVVTANTVPGTPHSGLLFFAPEKSKHFSDLNINHGISLSEHVGDIPVA